MTVEAISEVEDGIYPFSIVAINIAKSINPAPGAIFVIGEEGSASKAAREIVGAYTALDQIVDISDDSIADLKAGIVVIRSIDAVTKAALTEAKAIVALKNDFHTATSLVDVCEHASIYEIMGLIDVEGLVWVRGEGVTRFDLGW